MIGIVVRLFLSGVFSMLFVLLAAWVLVLIMGVGPSHGPQLLWACQPLLLFSLLLSRTEVSIVC